MKRRSDTSNFVIVIRLGLLFLFSLPAVYLAFELNSGALSDEISIAGYSWIATFCLLYYVVPSIVVVTGLLIKLSITRWIVLALDAFVIIMMVSVYGYLAMALGAIHIICSLIEVYCLFANPVYIIDDDASA